MSRLVVLPLLAAALAAALAGCLRSTSYQSCKTDSDCAGAGPMPRCEASGACSLADMSCASGYRYAPSAPSPNTCTPGGGTPDAMTDGPLDARFFSGHECYPHAKLTTAPTACEAKVLALEPRCGTEMWDDVCVRWAVTQCMADCTNAAFIGTNGNGFVIDTATHAVLWQDAQNDGSFGAWGDYDGDGYPDLAIATETKLELFRNRSFDGASLDLELTKSVDWATLGSDYAFFDPEDVAWADLDNDGKLDVMFVGLEGLVEFHNDGGGAFTEITLDKAVNDSGGTLQSPTYSAVAFGDYDGDGLADMALSRSQKSIMLWHNAAGVLTPTAWTTTTDTYFGNSLEWCNLDADPYPELVAAGGANGGYVAIANNTGGTVSPTIVPIDSAEVATSAWCGDYDGDGKLDVVATGYTDNPARAYLNGGTVSSFSSTWEDDNAATDKRYECSAGIGDLDGDHKLDLLVPFCDNNSPVELQAFTNVSTRGSVKFQASTHSSLTAQVQKGTSVRTTSLAVHSP